MSVHRGTSNGNERGSATTRRRRREWLIDAYRANVDVGLDLFEVGLVPCPLGEGIAACRCYRCGVLLTDATVTVDRIIPGVRGGTYRRDNIRPACGPCNSETGGALARRGRSTRKEPCHA